MRTFVRFAAAVSFALPGHAQTACIVDQQEVFAPQKTIVALASRSGASADSRLVIFRTKLRVNTDGAPNSYHPDDPQGHVKAINNIANGITVMQGGVPVPYAETIRIFKEFRDHNWTVPTGYEIKWDNVLAARKEKSRKIPCIFTSGEYKGYFGSLTSLKNKRSGASAGECAVADQLDERYVPALVIPKGLNPLKDFGVSIGDLLLAVNPYNGAIRAAVVGDEGPEDNLGEGSVALNMSLLMNAREPKTYSEAKTLDTGSQEMVIAIVPNSARYKLQLPYGADNIAARVEAWLSSHEWGTLQDFSRIIQDCTGTMKAPLIN